MEEKNKTPEEEKKSSIKPKLPQISSPKGLKQILQEKISKAPKLFEIFKQFKLPKISLSREELKKRLPKKPPKILIILVIFFFVIIFLSVVSRMQEKKPVSETTVEEEKELEEKATGISTLTDAEIRAQLETRTSRLEQTLEGYDERIIGMEKKVNKVVKVGKVMEDYQANLDKSITSAMQKVMPEIESKFRNIVAAAPTVPTYPTWEKKEEPLYKEEVVPGEKTTTGSLGGETTSGEEAISEKGAIPTPYPRRVPRKIQILSREEEEEEITPLITESATPRTPYVYLPLGSFAKGTLLTGAYAPTDETNPLPILISIDEAFYGPSRSRIPLKGCLAIGKAVGDMNSARAIIQIVSISYVMPDGRVFETEGDLGYVVDTEGILGVPGKIVRKTGRVLTGAFATGFLSGAATGLAAGETTTFVSPETGVATQVITGDFLKAAQYKGLAEAANRMSDYYARELEKITTAIQIDTGQKINLVMQKGVIIEGFQPKTYMFGARPPSVFD